MWLDLPTKLLSTDLEVLELLLAEQRDHAAEEVEREHEVADLEEDHHDAEAAHVARQPEHLRRSTQYTRVIRLVGSHKHQ